MLQAVKLHCGHVFHCDDLQMEDHAWWEWWCLTAEAHRKSELAVSH